MPSAKEKGLICVGRLSDPQGVRGGIRLQSFTERPETIKEFRAFFTREGETLYPSFGQQLKDGYVIMLEGVANPEEAKKWKGRELFVKRAELKAPGVGEYYHADLIDLSVKTTDGKRLGKVTGINNFGAGDVIEIALKVARKGVGKTLVVPFRAEVVKDVNLGAGTMLIDTEGWLED